MSESSNSFITISVGNTISILTVLFVVLKLTHMIDWSWWWVLSPLWMPTVIVLSIIMLVGVATLMALLLIVIIGMLVD